MLIKSLKEKKCPVCLKKFTPRRPLQKYCSPICFYSTQEPRKPKCKGLKRKTTHKIDHEEIEKLKSRADSLFQTRGKEKFPYSIISGQPVEVIHHFIYKSQSKKLRYSFDNAIQLTNSEHCRHHQSGDPTIVSEILRKKGLKWEENLQKIRHSPGILKLNKEYLEGIIESLSTPTPF